MEIKVNNKILAEEQWCGVEVDGVIYDLCVYYDKYEGKYMVLGLEVDSCISVPVYLDELEVI